MAQIFIKKRKEPIFISDERAGKLKKIWLENPKSDDLVDLEIWTGEIRMISSIEIEKERKENRVDYEKEHREAVERILKQPPEVRAKHLGEFELNWFMRSGMNEKHPPQEVMQKAEAIALKYFTENPNQIRVPRELYEPLMFARFGVKNQSANSGQISNKLAEKMTVSEPVKKSDVPF